MQRYFIPLVCVTLILIVLLILFWEMILYGGACVALFFAFQLNVYTFKKTKVFWRYALAMSVAGAFLWYVGFLLHAVLVIAFLAMLVMALGRTKFRKTQAKPRRKFRRLRPSIN